MKKFWITLCLVIVAGAALWTYRERLPYVSALLGKGSISPASASTAENGNRKKSGAPVVVKTVAAVETTLPMDVTATGWVVPVDSTTIAAQESGVITQIVAQDGATVRAGDLIAKLDPRTAQATVDKDKAVYAKDQATLAQTESALTRAMNLLSSKAGTQATADEAQEARDAAVATAAADKAQLASDEVLLEHTDIRAPYDGRLGDISLSLGAYVSPGTAIVTITKYDPAFVKFNLQETSLRQLQEALAAGPVPVSTVPRSAKGKPRQGEVSFFDNTVDSASGTIIVKAKFDNANGALWPGRSENVSVHFSDKEPLIVVPTVAVAPGPDGFIAFVVGKDSKVHVTPVTVARANGDRTAVAKGLAVGDHVIIEGQSQVTDGQTIKEEFSDGSAQKVASAADGKAENFAVGAQP
ncbi:efflux RND transporter periplasmic adaptor subunit [Rhizobium tumorigenes]|uniref:efflux RND transporter periplasmic adaptor subunit n=1 Tax=Rhizobium tumorigenes TaxID=2041385 RepID=UPI00241FA31E|nr:efflux RND transporter periplasmic adaptor subunit [Rhizobium tumorigenes]WFS01782.1 efflux RND transporter periplasmic adaptor subunit [Rhizobium tumorigenes]